MRRHIRRAKHVVAKFCKQLPEHAVGRVDPWIALVEQAVVGEVDGCIAEPQGHTNRLAFLLRLAHQFGEVEAAILVPHKLEPWLAQADYYRALAAIGADKRQEIERDGYPGARGHGLVGSRGIHGDVR